MTGDHQEDCWGAFGSDQEEDSDDGIVGDNAADPLASKSALAAASEVTLFLAKTFLHANSKVPIGQRRIALLQAEFHSGARVLEETLARRGFTNLAKISDSNGEEWYDALIAVYHETTSTELLSKMDEKLVPGGIFLILALPKSPGVLLNDIKADPAKWVLEPCTIFQDDNLEVLYVQKSLCQVQDRTCLWLPSSHSLQSERVRLGQATVPLSAHEIQSSRLSEPSLVRAVQSLQEYGYCILPRLLDPQHCEEWGRGVLSDLHLASKILMKKEGVNILNPHASQKDPQSYRELSMREDLRMDLRDGPRLRQLRGQTHDQNKPIVIPSHPSAVAMAEWNPFFRLHPSILEVVQRTMNPKSGTLYQGNFGRHNFGGTGPDGSHQDLRLSAIGGIVSLPGSADQALHADTPHLFEHQTLPAHYINAFTLGCPGHAQVGCTAFVHGSHRLEFTAEYLAQDPNILNAAANNNHTRVFEFLVRPQLELGDVVLFDCRVLHFGLANASKDVERPLLYCNMTHAWFHDPKNWDDHHPIFEGL